MTKSARRNAALRQMLNDRRREMQDDVHSRVRGGRADRPKTGDELEQSDASIQGELDLALLQMRADTLVRIEQALARLDDGKYGSCYECAAEIAEPRLRALPFAVRCLPCEERREGEHGRARQHAQKAGAASLFPDALSS